MVSSWKLVSGGDLKIIKGKGELVRFLVNEVMVHSVVLSVNLIKDKKYIYMLYSFQYSQPFLKRTSDW